MEQYFCISYVAQMYTLSLSLSETIFKRLGIKVLQVYPFQCHGNGYRVLEEELKFETRQRRSERKVNCKKR